MRNFSLKSNLAKFLNLLGGSWEEREKMMRDLCDFILLLLDMHGIVQRGILMWAYSVRAERACGYDAITADSITFVLQTVAKNMRMIVGWQRSKIMKSLRGIFQRWQHVMVCTGRRRKKCGLVW